MSVSQDKSVVAVEDTPNPNSNKFVLSHELLQGGARDFPHADAAAASPLARDLFMLPDVSGVFLGANFVTVSVKPPANWWALRPLITQTIENFLSSGRPIIEGAEAGAAAEPARALSPTEVGIIRILETEIRPAVAMDGGDISFVAFDNGVLKVRLRGACHSCPSSTITLKAGIENRLKQEFPEITAVEPV